MFMEKWIVFGLLSIPVIILSWRTLFNVKSHGFYRFFSWECIIWLFITNYSFWFDNPLSIKQIVSWIFLLFSVYLVVTGVVLMKSLGKPKTERVENSLYQFEKTTQLVDQGIFKYIRHPLYSSLLFLTWGIFFKNTTGLLFLIAMLSSVFLFLTALADEKECIKFFGVQYAEYMKRSKRFIPFLL
jgi:protein-S-isoprenylcysteine O-methyltransferase Ste14